LVFHDADFRWGEPMISDPVTLLEKEVIPLPNARQGEKEHQCLAWPSNIFHGCLPSSHGRGRARDKGEGEGMGGERREKSWPLACICMSHMSPTHHVSQTWPLCC
ncbi:hypothetical protein EE612_017907, partial [Oryza sativa]